MLAELAPNPATRTQQLPPAVWPPRKRWTREECRTLDSTGLWDRERLELIEGHLLTRMSKKRPHVIAYVLMLEWLTQVFGALYLNPESPIDVAPEDNPTSESEPDFAVLTKTATEYTTGNPAPSDIRLLIEISDSTLAFDLGPKARLHVHRDPANGSYSTSTATPPTEATPPSLPATKPRLSHPSRPPQLSSTSRPFCHPAPDPDGSSIFTLTVVRMWGRMAS